MMMMVMMMMMMMAMMMMIALPMMTTTQRSRYFPPLPFFQLTTLPILLSCVHVTRIVPAKRVSTNSVRTVPASGTFSHSCTSAAKRRCFRKLGAVLPRLWKPLVATGCWCCCCAASDGSGTRNDDIMVFFFKSVLLACYLNTTRTHPHRGALCPVAVVIYLLN
jgi:hypothetical protein